MDYLDTREWLLTNGLGSFASGTVCDARTRTYHGWLVAALEPFGCRRLLLSHLEASLEVAGDVFSLGTNFWTGGKVDPPGYLFLKSFRLEPVPTWVWAWNDQWELTRQISMPGGTDAIDCLLSDELGENRPIAAAHRLIVRYHYRGTEAATLRLRPLIADRDFHRPQQQRPGLSFSQVSNPRRLLLQALQDGKAGTSWQLQWTQGHYQPDEVWYWSFFYPAESERGLDCMEDLYSPGYLALALQPESTVTLEASVGLPGEILLPNSGVPLSVASEDGQTAGSQAMGEWQALLRARDRFLVYPHGATEPRLLAGYHWFSDRSRDTLLCLPGFALSTGQPALARSLLKRLGQLCWQGLIPNDVPETGNNLVFRSIDISLWWIEVLGLYLETTQDWDFLTEQYEVVKQIYKAFTAGTLHNIRVDASDGLLTWDDPSIALTWMDAMVDGRPVTPRHGKPIEVNALWYSALCWASQWGQRLTADPAIENVERLQNQARRYLQQAQQVKASLQKFWNPKTGYLYDRIEPDDRLDGAVRPNAVLALALHHCAFSNEQARLVLSAARDRLLTPYGLRTLDAADPRYVGSYTGDPMQRDQAAHQGTVWSWLLGPFTRAWVRFCPDEPLPFDMTVLLTHFREEAGLHNVSELFDGDFPHTPRGAIAHAVAISELIRCWEFLQALPNPQRVL